MDRLVSGDHLIFSIKDRHKNIEQLPNMPFRNLKMSIKWLLNIPF
jgi:hypothetical protein